MRRNSQTIYLQLKENCFSFCIVRETALPLLPKRTKMFAMLVKLPKNIHLRDTIIPIRKTDKSVGMLNCEDGRPIDLLAEEEELNG